MKDDIISILDNHDWIQIILKLSAYSIYMCNLKRIRLPKGLEPEDLAMIAIEKVYNGERNWNSEGSPDLLLFLQSVVNSLISNSKKSSDVTVSSLADVPESSLVESQYIDEELYCNQLDQEIIRKMSNDPLLCLIYKSLKEQYKPKEISEVYGIDISIIRNAQKRLHRIVLEVVNQLSKISLYEKY
jgi:hypothetical protein